MAEMLPLPERPFFIVGNPRSGTTLLRFILSSHPRLYVPAETGFLPFLPRHGQRPLSLQRVQALLHRIGRLNDQWRDLVQDAESFYETMREPTLRHVLDALYRRKVAQQGARAARWGDKTPTYVRYIPELNQIFPQAQFIHVIRDARDVTLSAMKKWGSDRWYMDCYYLLKNWSRNVTSGHQAGQGLGSDRYLELHYEALVNDPPATVSRLCEFLQEGMNRAMLDHTRLAQEKIGPGGHVEVRRPITASSVGRWREEMSSFNHKLSFRLVGSTLEDFGYPPGTAQPMTPIEEVRYVLLAAKYVVSDTLRRALYSAGFLTLNRGRRR